MMSLTRMFQWFVCSLVSQTIGHDMRSFQMSLMNGRLFQCANTTCPPSTILTVSNIRSCQIACLNEVSCQAASFQPATSSCQLFTYNPNQDESVSTNVEIVIMIVMSGTREPSAPAMEWNTTEIVFSGSGTGLNQINEPYSIFIPPTENALYIADNGNNRILRWPLNASAAKVVAGGQGPGSNATQLDSPRAVYVTKNGSILVSDLGNHRAQYFVNGSLVGRRVAGDGTPGSANTQIGLAIGGIAMDLNDNVYISEYDNSRVAKWAPNATYGTLAAGDGSPGNAPSQLSDPTGLYLDPISNILYIASQGGHCIMKWLPGASTGSTVAGTCGVSGNTTTLLTAPRCVTFDKYGNMYVADMSDSGRIITFPPNSMIGRPIITSGLSNPMAVALDEKLNLYVADYGHDRIVKYELL